MKAYYQHIITTHAAVRPNSTLTPLSFQNFNAKKTINLIGILNNIAISITEARSRIYESAQMYKIIEAILTYYTANRVSRRMSLVYVVNTDNKLC